MNTFILMYIAILLSLYFVISKNIILISEYLPDLPIIALFITAICFALYLLASFLIKRFFTENEEHYAICNYPTNETEEERKARVNAEVDKIIEEQRNNKKQS